MSPLAGEADSKGYLGRDNSLPASKSDCTLAPRLSGPYEFWTRIVVQKVCELPEAKLSNK